MKKFKKVFDFILYSTLAIAATGIVLVFVGVFLHLFWALFIFGWSFVGWVFDKVV